MRIFLIAMSILVLTISEAFAGAWTLPRKHIYLETYNKYYWAKDDFDGSEHHTRRADNGKFEDLSTFNRLEYGITDDLNFILVVPYRRYRSADDKVDERNDGFGDIKVEVKRRLIKAPYVLSVLIGGDFPTGYSEDAYPKPSLGKQQVSGHIKLLAGKSFSTLPFHINYIGGELGFRGRDEEPTNEITYFYEMGYNISRKLLIKATLDGVEGLARTGDSDEDYTKANFSFVWNLKGGFGSIFRNESSINFELGLGNTFYGKNTAAAWEIIASLSYSY